MAELIVEKPFTELTEVLNILDPNEIVHFEDIVTNYPTIEALPESWEGYINVNGNDVENWWVEPNNILHINCTVSQLQRIIKQDFTLIKEDYETLN